MPSRAAASRPLPLRFSRTTSASAGFSLNLRSRSCLRSCCSRSGSVTIWITTGRAAPSQDVSIGRRGKDTPRDCGRPSIRSGPLGYAPECSQPCRLDPFWIRSKRLGPQPSTNAARPVARAPETNETLPPHYRKTPETKAVYDNKNRRCGRFDGRDTSIQRHGRTSSLVEVPTRLAPKPEVQNA